MTERGFYFNPIGKDLEVFLGPTESALMKILWKHHPLTVKKALFYWHDQNRPAYTTVMTILTRLHEKGLLHRKKVGRNYLYTPSMTRAQFLEERLQQISDCMERNFHLSLKKT